MLAVSISVPDPNADVGVQITSAGLGFWVRGRYSGNAQAPSPSQCRALSIPVRTWSHRTLARVRRAGSDRSTSAQFQIRAQALAPWRAPLRRCTVDAHRET